jgi:hypothetical protein
MGIVTGEIYSFYVVAQNYIGDSVQSGLLENVVAGSLPTAPINFKRALTVTPVDNRISLQWDAPVDDGGTAIMGYTVMWNGGLIGGAIPMDALISTDAVITFHTEINLVRGETYKFTVAAVNLVGVGPSTSILSLLSCQAPGIPQDIERLSFNSPTTILIGWTAPADDGGSPATGDYQVYSDQGLRQGYTLIKSST